MKPLMILLKREWLEWQRVVIGTILVITFLNFLMLLSVARGSSYFHETLGRESHINMEHFEINGDDIGEVDIRMDGNNVEIFVEGENAADDINRALSKASTPVALGLRLGMQGIFIFVLFQSKPF